MKRKLSVSFLTVVITIVSQLVMYGVIALVIFNIGTSATELSQKETFKLLNDSIKWSIENELSQASILLDSLREDTTLLKLFKERNRTALFAHLSPTFDRVKNRVKRMHVHLADGTSFLRMHDPESYGDRLIDIRPMVRTALQERIMVKGLEIGKDGIGLRVITPLFYNGEYLGALECGMDFGEDFVRELKNKYSYNFFIFLLNGSSGFSYFAGSEPYEQCPLAEHSIEKIMSGESVWSVDCSKAKAVALYPFTDYSGKIIGFFKIEILHIPFIDALTAMKNRFVISSTIITVIVSILIIISLQLIILPLNSVVQQTIELSAKITAGDLTLPTKVQEPTLELQEIVDAVNDIILALRERGAVLQAIVEGIPGIVFYVDREHKILWANQLAKEHFKDLESPNILDSGKGFFEHEQALLNEAFQKGSIVTVEACYIRETGAQECWEHVAVPIAEADNIINNVIRISRDITDKKIIEAELRILNEDLEHRVEEEIKKREEKERIAAQQSRLAAIGELATGMAHEITQPLNSITIALGNLEARFKNNSITTEYLAAKFRALNSDIDRVRRVIDHVRTFARGTPDEYTISFLINQCIENALELIGVQLATHNIDVVRNLDDSIPYVYGNPYQYEQVVLNLLSNARDAIEERIIAQTEQNILDIIPGKILIQTYKTSNQAVLVVEDNGIGINESIAERIFDPFFTTKPQGKGTGLGLSIAYGIIKKMNGTISMEHNRQVTRFIVEVPFETKRVAREEPLV